MEDNGPPVAALDPPVASSGKCCTATGPVGDCCSHISGAQTRRRTAAPTTCSTVLSPPSNDCGLMRVAGTPSPEGAPDPVQ